MTDHYAKMMFSRYSNSNGWFDGNTVDDPRFKDTKVHRIDETDDRVHHIWVTTRNAKSVIEWRKSHGFSDGEIGLPKIGDDAYLTVASSCWDRFVSVALTRQF